MPPYFATKRSTFLKLKLPNQWIKLPTLRQLDLNRTATQILTAEYQIKDKIQTYTSQVQVETTPEKLVLVAIAGWGGEIFRSIMMGRKSNKQPAYAQCRAWYYTCFK